MMDRADSVLLDLGRRPWVAYASPYPFPWGLAGSRRIAGVASSILATGRDVVVLSGAEPPGARILGDDPTGARLWVVGTEDLPSSRIGLVRRNFYYHLLGGSAAVKWLQRQSSTPSHVVVYGGGASYAARLGMWTRRRRVAVVVDVDEWFSTRQFKGGVLAPSWLSAQVSLRAVYPRFDGVIAISEFLANRYASPSRPIVLVPPTLDVSAVALADPRLPQANGEKALVFCYFGTPGKKDLLPEIVDAFADVQSTHDGVYGVRLVIVGPSYEEVAAASGGKIPPGVEVVGRIAQPDVARFVQSANFSVLLRPHARYSAAGFPTKFVESLANGTPVIANLTSDLDQYLIDGGAGLVVDEPTAKSLAETIRRATALSENDLAAMRREARRVAVDGFDYRAHVSAIGTFLDATKR